MSEDKKVYGYARPLPCVRDEYGEIKTQSVRQLLAKIDEELTELKEAAFLVTWYSLLNQEILNEASSECVGKTVSYAAS